MLLILIGQCQTKHIERNLSFDGFWTCSVLPDHWRLVVLNCLFCYRSEEDEDSEEEDSEDDDEEEIEEGDEEEVDEEEADEGTEETEGHDEL